MSDMILGRIKLFAGFSLIMALFSFEALASDITVFDVRKSLPLTDTEVVYRDYFISGGSDSGLKVDMIVPVIRRVSVNNSLQKQSSDPLIITVGKLKIIHVQKNLSVGRVYALETAETAPFLEYDAIMSGDFLDIQSATFEKPAKKASATEPDDKKTT